MDKLMITFPNYSIGEKALEDLDKICLSYGKKILALGGKKALEKTRGKIENILKRSGLEIIDFAWYGGECTNENINRLANIGKEEEADMIIGIGGGKALDTAKAVADKLNVPVFTIPTIAATCAAITKLSVVYTHKGEFESFYFLEKPPVHCFMDSDIIAKAPAKYLRAGMGDTIAKHYECLFSSRGDKLSHSSGMGVEISSMCVKPILQYGEKALEHCEKALNSFEVEQVILNNIISTGLVSILVEEKYNGALAHSLFYGLTVLEHIEKNYLHGDVVAYGVLVQLAMDNNLEELKKLYSFYKEVNFPICLGDIEVPCDRAYLEPVLEETVKGPDMEHLPYKVTKDMIFEAILNLEKFS